MQKITKFYKNKSGVYCILNIKNNKRYIGSSQNINERLVNHIVMLRRNKHYNPIIQNSYNKYKEENFIWFVLEYCKKEDRFKKEQYYIDILNPEFNIIKKVTENNITTQKVFIYSLEGKFLKEFDKIKDACIYYKVHQTTACRAFKRKEFQEAAGLRWYKTYQKNLKPYKKKKLSKPKLYKKVGLFKDGILIEEYKSLKECAEKLNKHRVSISQYIKYDKFVNKKYKLKKL